MTLTGVLQRIFPKQKAEHDTLLDDLEEIKLRLETAYNRFEFVSEEELVDACSYEIQSLETQYSRLWRKAKECGLQAEPFHARKISQKS